jgi:hypothetical protein
MGKRPLPPSLTSEELREIQKAERKQRSPTIRPGVRMRWKVVAKNADPHAQFRERWQLSAYAT